MSASTPAFVCFHLTPPNEGTAETYWAFFQIMAATIRRICPAAEIHLLTNTHSNVPADLNLDQVFRQETARSQKECFERLMVEEVDCWQAYFASSMFQGPSVLIDVDLLIQKDPFGLFDGGFDIGLTYTDDPALHPFNSGVIFVDPARPARVRRYFDLLARRVESYAPEFQEWYGDQMAIAALLDDPDYSTASPAIIDQTKDEINYRLWPTEQWNYSLPLGDDNKPIFQEAPVPGILHFKGERKALMLRYAVEILGFEAVENSVVAGGWLISDPLVPE
jgi:hypothetical protein